MNACSLILALLSARPSAATIADDFNQLDFVSRQLSQHNVNAYDTSGQKPAIISDDGKCVILAKGIALDLVGKKQWLYGSFTGHPPTNRHVTFGDKTVIRSLEVCADNGDGSFIGFGALPKTQGQPVLCVASIRLAGGKPTILSSWQGYDDYPTYIDRTVLILEYASHIIRSKVPWPKVVELKPGAGKKFQAIVQTIKSMPNRQDAFVIAIDPSGTYAVTTRPGAIEIVSPKLKQPKIVAVESNDEWSETEQYYWLGSDLLVTDYSRVKKQGRLRLLSTKSFEWSHLASGKLLAYSRNGKHLLVQQGERIQLLSRK